MKNLCFIGTSHLGVLAQAWTRRLAPNYPEFTASFFGGPGQSLYQAEFLPNQIKAPANSQLEEFFQLSAGRTTIELNQYAAFIFQGLDFPLNSFIEINDLMHEDSDSLNQQFFSSDCLETAIKVTLRRSPVKTYVEHIRQHVNAPIIISLSPRISILAFEKSPAIYKNYLDQAYFFEDLFTQAREAVFQYENLSFIEQPQDTLAAPYPCFTKYEYLNSYGQISPKVDQDLGHKNVKYGKLTLTKIMEHIKTLEL